jgi:hypothetical protein
MCLKDEYSLEKGFTIGIIAILLPTSGLVFGTAMMSNRNANYIMDNKEIENTIFNRFKSGFMAGFMHPINIINGDEFELSIKKCND